VLLLHEVAFSKYLHWLAQTKVNTLKMQPHAVNRPLLVRRMRVLGIPEVIILIIQDCKIGSLTEWLTVNKVERAQCSD